MRTIRRFSSGNLRRLATAPWTRSNASKPGAKFTRFFTKLSWKYWISVRFCRFWHQFFKFFVNLRTTFWSCFMRMSRFCMIYTWSEFFIKIIDFATNFLKKHENSPLEIKNRAMKTLYEFFLQQLHVPKSRSWWRYSCTKPSCAWWTYLSWEVSCRQLKTAWRWETWA